MAFIDNPTHLHAEAISQVAGKANALFIEKPIFEALGYDLQALGCCPKKGLCGGAIALLRGVPGAEGTAAKP